MYGKDLIININIRERSCIPSPLFIDFLFAIGRYSYVFKIYMHKYIQYIDVSHIVLYIHKYKYMLFVLECFPQLVAPLSNKLYIDSDREVADVISAPIEHS